MNLSVTVITSNEESNLERCLKSVRELADDIVVVDSGSSDNTVEIAKKMGARVFEKNFTDYASQKNFAVGKAQNDWVLSVDADEVITPELAKEIKKAVKKDEYSAFSIPRKNIILGKFIRYTRWQPELDRHIWLFKKSSGKWKGKVHEEFLAKGKVGKLKHPKLHYQHETISDFLNMMNEYSEIEAEQKFKSGVNFSILRVVFDPLYNFSVRYFYRLGFLDGWRGYVLSFLMAIYHLEIWFKIWEKKFAN